MSEPPVIAPRSSAAPEAPSLSDHLRCAHCETPLSSHYFSVNGQALCDACRARASGSVLQALGLSVAGAAALVGVYYVILAATGFRFILLPILSGVAIGTLVNRGNRAGNRAWLRGYAVALTYVATAMTYLHTLRDLPDYQSLPRALSYALVLPLDMAMQFKNVVSLVLLALGLHEAFAFSGMRPLKVLGPFPVEPLRESMFRAPVDPVDLAVPAAEPQEHA